MKRSAENTPTNSTPPLRRLRVEAGLTLRAAARGIGVELSYLSKIERGQARPRPPMAKRILAFYGLTGEKVWEFFPGLAGAA